MKKRKLKIKNIIVAFCIFLFLIFLLFSCQRKEKFVIKLENNEANYGEEYTPVFEATYKGKTVTEEVTYENHIDPTKLGKGELLFHYENHVKKVIVSVKDLEAPALVLKGGKKVILSIQEEYKEPGYEATDNVDGNLTDKVKVEGKVDSRKEGTYSLTYMVSDKSGNKKEMLREVVVTKDSPVNMDPRDFTLDGYFNDVILEQTEDYGEEYIDEFIFAGDSMALYYVINDAVSGRRLWHQISINPETAYTNPIYINHIETEKTFIQNMKERKPEKMIFTLGTNGAIMKTEYFIECYKKLIEGMLDASPDTVLIIQAIPPVDHSYDENERGINNRKINELNYYIAKMCSELGIPFLNSAEAMKDENGGCKEGYCLSSDGIHPTEEGTNALIHYMRTHAYIK